jgi:antitoxin ParD1/3/4
MSIFSECRSRAMRKPTTINISMPGTLEKFVRDRIAKKGYGNTSEYFRQLVREDQKRAEDEILEALLLDGLNSGPPEEMTDQWWADRKRELAARLKKRKTG